jgi:hypothetical protein
MLKINSAINTIRRVSLIGMLALLFVKFGISQQPVPVKVSDG